MGTELDKLIKHAIENDPEVAKKIALGMYRAYIRDKKATDALLDEHIVMDLWEMESLVNSKKFEFPKGDIGVVGIENDE